MRKITVALVITLLFVALVTLTWWYWFQLPTVSHVEQDVIEAAIGQAPESSTAAVHILGYQTLPTSFLCGGQNFDECINDFRKAAKTRESAFREALEDFIEKNQSKVELRFGRKLPENTRLLDARTLRRLKAVKGGNFYPGFYQLYPLSKGIVSVSRPGLDRQATTAIIAVDQTAGPLSAIGSIRIFRYVGGQWVLQERDYFGPSWIS